MFSQRALDRRLFLAASGWFASCAKPTSLKIGWKSGAEQNVLAELAAQLAAKRLNIPVERLAVGATTEAHQSLLSSLIDVYPEYPSAAIAEVLKQDPPTDAGALLEMCRAQYQPLQLEWLEPLGYESKTTLVMLTSEAQNEKLGVASDLVFRDRAWRLGVTRDFQRRRDGFGALQKTYSLRLKEAPRVENDEAGLFTALTGKAVDLICAETSSSQLSDPKFTALNDDRLGFSNNRPGFVIRQDADTRFPGLRKTLGALSGKISLQSIREMSRAVDSDKKPAADVAAQFLRTLGA